MSRPKKQTVDYFPHYCNHKSTMFIVEQKYGNNGYAFWFKLLEMLGDTEGHIIDCRNSAKWEFLQAKTRTPENTCIKLLDLLAKLEAIDSNLWKEKVIWSDNFITGIAEVYRNRRVEIPIKPSFYTQKPDANSISTPNNPHMKVNEMKVEYIGVDKKKVNDIIKRKKSEKTLYRDFVYLTDKEYQALIEKFGEEHAQEMIERVNSYVGSKGVKYTSHYHTIINWQRMEDKKAIEKGKEPFQRPKTKEEKRQEAEAENIFYEEAATRARENLQAIQESRRSK